MDNLWKKEENQCHSVYVDLFASFLEENPQAPNLLNATINLDARQKNNQRSTELRNAGNEKFLSKNIFDAIRYYNQSLCFAETGSENIPLAYVNRSACFSRLKMYDKAFRDIELAKKANLPVRMQSKVEKLEKDSQKLMDCLEKRTNYLPTLSYEADKNYTCMANVLEIKENDVFGRYIVAKCDIPVGKIILLEECFVACTKSCHDLCCTCYSQMDNFIPCPHCPDVLFCSVECSDRNSIHKWECGTSSITNPVNTKLATEAILLAIETFSNADNLMNFVVKVLCGNDTELPTFVNDAESKFHFYFKLTKTGMFHDQLLANVREVYNSLLAIRKIAEFFDSEEKRRFLMHLTAHIYYINRANAIGSETIRRVINVFSILNHSCSPNLYTRHAGKVHHCITIRPVKKGEQLFINYLGIQNQTLNERRTELISKWDFLCECDKCEQRNQSIDSKQMIADPSFTLVTEHYEKMEEPSIVLEECEKFLNKYAHRTWSEEIEAVSEIYRSALILENFKNTL